MYYAKSIIQFAREKCEPVFFGVAGFGIVIALVIHLFSLTQYPPVFIDEPWTADIAWTRLNTGINFETMHSGPLDQYGYAWTIRNFLGVTPFVLSFAIFGLGLFQARLVSFVFGVVLLLAVIMAGRASYSWKTGILAALFLSLSQPYLNSSHWARQDIMLAAMVVLAYGMSVYALEKETWWAHFLAGLILGLSVDIHENASLFIPGLVIVYIANYRSKFLNNRGTWLAALGGSLGFAFYIAYHILPNPGIYQILSGYDYAYLHAFPIQNFKLIDLLTSLDQEVGRYHFYDNNLDFAIIGASVVFLSFRHLWFDRVLLTFVGSAFTCFVLFQGSKYEHYAILFYPFFMLVAAEMFISVIRTKKMPLPQVALIGSLLLLLLFNSTIHFIRPIVRSRAYDYGSVTSQLKSAITPGARVLGSPNWWFDLSEFDYRSYKTLQYYNFYHGYDLVDGLQSIRPDVIIVDPFMELELFGRTTFYQFEIDEPQLSYEEFQKFLDLYGEKELEISDPWYGQLQIYSIHWNDD